MNRLRNEIEEEWEKEPDFTSLKVGEYHFIILRHGEMGHLNAYIGVPSTHLAYKKSKNILGLHCHGGITYQGSTIYGMESDLWYFGFDCAHAGDLIPRLPLDFNTDMFPKELNELFEKINNPFERTYKDIGFVSKELEKLHEQLEAFRSVPSSDKGNEGEND